MPQVIAFLGFVFTVWQQPVETPYTVSAEPNVLTQSALTCCGNIGLFAHEVPAGYAFAYLEVGNTITVEFSDGHVEMFKVTEIKRYLASDPASVYSNFTDIKTGGVFGSAELAQLLFNEGGYHMVMQTCFDGINGRLFVMAYPIPAKIDRLFMRRVYEDQYQ